MMKKLVKKLMIIITPTLLFGVITMNNYQVYANENISVNKFRNISNDYELKQFVNDIKKLSIPELENIIKQAEIDSHNRMIAPNAGLRTAWLAAAQIARIKGYDLAATLVEHSIFNKNYNETNGKFAREIKKTNVFKRIMLKRNGSDRFTKNDHSDLFYAIHKFSFENSFSSWGTKIRVYDTFDFKYESSYKDLLTTIANNMAYLSQNMFVLNPIKVYIGIDL